MTTATTGRAEAARTGTSTMTHLKAMNAGLYEEMERDPSIFVMGQDVEVGTFGLTAGLIDVFGRQRVRNTPIAEAVEVGAAVGAAMCGMRPWVELNIATFAYPAMDQLVNQVAKNRFLFGGQAKLPLVVHLVSYHRSLSAAQHTDRPHPMFMNIPGFKIVHPTNPADAKGMLKAALRDDDPVLFFDDMSIATRRGPVPNGDYVVSIGKAAVARPGTDLTIVSVFSTHIALEAAEELAAKHGLDVEVIDPRTLAPLDEATILASVRKTGRLVVTDMAHRVCSAASEISAIVAEKGFASLRAPIERVATPMAHVPFAPEVEAQFFPSKESIMKAARRVAAYPKEQKA